MDREHRINFKKVSLRKSETSRLIFLLFVGSIGLIVFLSTVHLKRQIQDSPRIEATNFFDSIMSNLNSKYPELPQKSDTNEYSELYRISNKTSYYSYIYGDFATPLTMELREYCPSPGQWNYQVIYIYDDSTHKVLPLLDLYYLKSLGSSEPKSFDEIKKYLSFETELNNVINTFSAKDIDKIWLVTEIMSLGLSAKSLNTLDIEGMIALNNSIQKIESYSDHCKASSQDNLPKILDAIQNPNVKVYGNYFLLYTVDFSDSKLKTEFLNFECYQWWGM